MTDQNMFAETSAALDVDGAPTLAPAFSEEALTILNQGREASLATLRPDGWPQSTIVNYVNDETHLYFDSAVTSQKAQNIALDDRISMSLVVPYPAYGPIYGLSLAGHARLIESPKELAHALDLWKARYPYMRERLTLDLTGSLPGFGFYAVKPTVLTKLHYTAGLGHRH